MTIIDNNSRTVNVMRRFCFMILLLILSAKTFAQNVTASLDSDEVVVNTKFKISYKIDDVVKNVDEPNIDNVEILGSSKGRNVTIVNGNRSAIFEFVYSFLPQKEGQLTIPPFQFELGNGKKIESKPISIEVKPQSAIQQSHDSDYYVALELSEEEVSIGQKFYINYVLYSKTGVAGVDIVKESDFKGFKTNMAKHPQGYNEVKVNGERFYKRILLSYESYAQKSGTFKIEPFTIEVGIPVENARPDIFGNIPTKDKYLASKEAIIKVKQLNGVAPESFSGGIGRFTMETTTRDTVITTDDAITVKMEITGTGNAKFWEQPRQNAPDEWEAFSPKLISEKKVIATFGPAVKKTYEYVYLPKKEGKYTFTPEFSYYDSDNSKYVTLKDKTFHFDIKKGNNKVDDLPTDEKIKVKPPIIKTKKDGMNYPLIIGGILILGLSAYLLSKVFRKKEKDSKEHIPTHEKKVKKTKPKKEKSSKKSKSAGKIDFSRTEENLKNKHLKAFYQSLSLDLHHYIGDKYNMTNIELTHENIVEKMQQDNVASSYIDELISILNQCDMATYGGLSGDANDLFRRSKRLIDDLEQ